MFGIGMPELIIILVIILIIFGAGKLPEIGAGMGKAIRNFKGAGDEEEKKEPEKIEEEKEKENQPSASIFDLAQLILYNPQ